jgi:exodeoxyribonuclease VII large subunit
VSQPSFDFGEEYADGARDDTYTVSQLATAINDSLRRRFSDGVWVRGEIQGCYERGPHLYFKLVEHVDGAQASIDVALFAPSRTRLRPILQKHRLTLADGLKVRIFGQLDFYAVSGKLSLKMSGLDPRFTLGELALNRDELIRRLTADGVLTANAGVPFSPAPLRIGVVTSVGSAAWADFRHEIERSGLGFRLSVVDVRVQGEAATMQIAAALRWFSGSPRAPRVDALALIRGGGSRTDLAIFDTEAVALAIADSRRPVLTGLGHEIDRSVADMAAHTALKTPTACATHLVERVTDYAQGMEERWSAVCTSSGRHLDRAGARLIEVAHAVHRRTNGAVTRAEERTGERARRVDTSARAVLDRAGLRLDNIAATLRNRSAQALASEARHVDSIESQVRLADPAVLLQRGWSITRGADGHVVRDVSTVRPGNRLITHFAAGTVASTVDDVTVLPPAAGPPIAAGTTTPTDDEGVGDE